MKVVTIGGGPAGLYFALLMKKADPTHHVVVLERNGPDDAYGWGVVFSAQTLQNFRAADEPTYSEIVRQFAHWDDIDVHVKGRTITSGGHGFAGIARRTLLRILQQRARELGVELRFHCELRDDAELAGLGLGDADVIVAADGVNSVIRRKHADVFHPDLDVRPARFVWLGTTRRFDAFTFLFVENACGVYQAHAYRFDEGHSAFIVECDERSWRGAGFDTMDIDATIAACERMFAPWLDGHALLANLPPHQRAAPWVRFTRVVNERWHHGKIVLVGDAAHTAHFSIGSGTKLAMEDAIALARALDRESHAGTDAAVLERALTTYEEERRTDALRLQNAARNSMEWFENVRRYMTLEPEQFAYSLLTRSQRVSHENLRLRDATYLAGVERWFAGRADGSRSEGSSRTGDRGPKGGGDESSGARGAPPNSYDHAWLAVDRNRFIAPRTQSSPPSGNAPDRAPPPMFTPFTLRALTLANRVVVAPMDMYCATDGTPNDFHLVHLGARALGGAGLIMTEMTCVGPEARISLGCTGMYRDEHVVAWRRITEMAHRWSAAKICLQLGHSGSRGATRTMWEGSDEPLPADDAWSVIGPSPYPYGDGMQTPRAMTRADMERVRDEFVRATRMGIDAGFDMVELHCAHGYLLSSFITPLSNRRTDAYGGSLENRLRFPLEVFHAMRAVWPGERPMSVRISATDWVDGGVDGGEAVLIARAFNDAGADIVHVSAGQTSPHARPVYGRMFQTPLSDRIRNEGGVPTIAVGNITDPDQVNGIIAAGRADLCALARPHLADPNWTLHAAAQLGWHAQPWPVQYLTGKEQLERTLQRQRELELQGASTV